jgi:hypothetical protein
LSKRDLIRYSGPRKAEDIEQIEAIYETSFPEDYRQFLANYGTLISDEVVILGLEDPQLSQISVDQALLTMRIADPDTPMELVPLEIRENNKFVCLVCDLEKRKKFAPVVLLDLEEPRPLEELKQLAPCFRDYLFDRLSSLKNNLSEETDSASDKTWMVFEKHVLDYQEKFNYDHAKGGKLPRNTDWRPYRYCIQDVVFGVTVVRHYQEGNCLDVDVFLTADVPEYGPLAGARALTAFLLSEAYKCGGTMELRFTKNVEGGQIPHELQALALQYGIQFKQSAHGRIEALEAKALYAAMTGFSEKLQNHILSLEKVGKIRMARACYVVHHGVWSRDQMEMIVLGSENPESILSGQSRPEQRHLYYHDLLHARAALLAGMFERIMIQRERQSDDGVNFDMEDDSRKVEIDFDGETYLKSYRCDEPIELVWMHGAELERSVPENVLFQVLIRARGPADLLMHMSLDIKTAIKVKSERNLPTFILVPRDFVDLSKEWILNICGKATQAGIGILVCPEAVSSLDVEGSQRLAASRVLRQ